MLYTENSAFIKSTLFKWTRQEMLCLKAQGFRKKGCNKYLLFLLYITVFIGQVGKIMHLEIDHSFCWLDK